MVRSTKKSISGTSICRTAEEAVFVRSQVDVSCGKVDNNDKTSVRSCISLVDTAVYVWNGPHAGIPTYPLVAGSPVFHHLMDTDSRIRSAFIEDQLVDPPSLLMIFYCHVAPQKYPSAVHSSSRL